MNKTKNYFGRAAMTLLLTVLSFLSTGAWAGDLKIIVWLTDGNKTSVLFADMPEFTYADGNITLKSQRTELSWPLANLQKFTFEDITTDVREVKTADLDILSDNCAVYDLDGRLVKQQIKSLSELPTGTYIVKDGNTTIKVVRK
jgi:hypothetical protein